MIVLFLVFRKIVLWYWRMDEMADNLKLILSELKKLTGSSFDENQKKRREEVKRGPILPEEK